MATDARTQNPPQTIKKQPNFTVDSQSPPPSTQTHLHLHSHLLLSLSLSLSLSLLHHLPKSFTSVHISLVSSPQYCQFQFLSLSLSPKSTSPFSLSPQNALLSKPHLSFPLKIMLSSQNPIFPLSAAAGAVADSSGGVSGEDPSPPESSFHLLGLLLRCAELISSGEVGPAADILPEMFELATPFGSPADRVAAYFAHALHSRLISFSLLGFRGVELETLTLVSQMRKFHSVLQTYNSVTPFVKFSHFTANQAIFEALDGEDCVHVIDLDIMQGLQWPGLFHILASRPRKMVSVRVTGFGPSADLLAQTGRRLGEFAASLGLPFEFNAVEGRIGNVGDLSRLSVRPTDVTVVHWMHHSLYDITGSDSGMLRFLGAVRPRLVTMVEQDMTKTGSFLGRFVEALHYYSAMFDALGEGLGRDSVQRHQVEQQLFGCEIRNILAVGGPKRPINGGDGAGVGVGVDHVGQWGDELKRVGFEPFSLAGSPAAQASLLLGMFPWRGYTLVEENGCLRLGWKDLPLLTASAWQPSNFDASENI